MFGQGGLIAVKNALLPTALKTQIVEVHITAIKQPINVCQRGSIVGKCKYIPYLKCLFQIRMVIM